MIPRLNPVSRFNQRASGLQMDVIPKGSVLMCDEDKVCILGIRGTTASAVRILLNLNDYASPGCMNRGTRIQIKIQGKLVLAEVGEIAVESLG